MIYIFAIAAHGKGISGGDRIFMEFARRWSLKKPVKIFVWREGALMCRRSGLNNSKNLEIVEVNIPKSLSFNFLICYLSRIFYGVLTAFNTSFKDHDIVYSASEFWMDAIPGIVGKIKTPNVKWVAAWYQTAPNPFVGFKEGDRERSYRISAFYYWLVQVVIKPFIFRMADYILVNNDFEKKVFRNFKGKKIIPVLGAVDLENIGKYKNNSLKKIYDGVFQGRFHPQKGVVELIEIWDLVVRKKPDAKLIMVGDGPLMNEVKQRISSLKLDKNIKLMGYLFDGAKKYEIFQQSRIVLHPAFYDSGGMASAEAMAFGLPCVGFDLQSYKDYYPKGMVKVKKNDKKEFAKRVIELLEDKDKYRKIALEAKNMITQNWSWDKRAEEVYSQIL